ncbi:lanthionine synthetase-like protein [Haloactinospora alba]|uniref:Lanthionine synthetase-like protein n=1 Tax=Haloactinospora alba TaxID=405555 RepID=A0A543NNU3_9ACTN|nr:lanthionine synthetase C family protein [Haloactinospora alba]TQN33509.1 lanthionine synthetase-like protein [Haloactinospora alba]
MTVVSAGTAEASPPHIRAQCLASGTAGEALLHIAHARTGFGSTWQAHQVLATCACDLIADEHASLYLGAPAAAFALHTAASSIGGYENALRLLDDTVVRITQRRLEAAHARIDRRQRPDLNEYDLFYGLTGLGAYLLCRDADSPTLKAVLAYLVRLTRPLPRDDQRLPGWWSRQGPSGRITERFPRGHANLGMAHGVAGPLALLSLAARRGTLVDAQRDAIEHICAWLDTVRTDTQSGTRWPYWITTPTEKAKEETRRAHRPRPSWCYGTPGLARAQQLAGIALDDPERQRLAEHAMLACLSDRSQLARVSDAGICHGAAGILQTLHRMAEDAPATFTTHRPRLHALLRQHAPTSRGFLNGTHGVALAALTAKTPTMPCGWDACLLLA